MPPSKSKEPSVPMPSGGHAPATLHAKKNILRIANLFLAHVDDVSPEFTAKWGTDFEEIPEQYAADTEIYEHIATYLVKNSESSGLLSSGMIPLARPKSQILRSQLTFTSKLQGFMSLCMIWAEWR